MSCVHDMTIHCLESITEARVGKNSSPIFPERKFEGKGWPLVLTSYWLKLGFSLQEVLQGIQNCHEPKLL